MAISRITSQDATGSGSTSATATYPQAPTPGNLLVAITGDDVNSPTLTGWTNALSTSASAATNTDFWFKIAGQGESRTVTATDAGATHIELATFEYTGTANGPVKDKTATGGGIGTQTTSSGTTALTTNWVSELAIAGFYWNAFNQASPSYTNSYTSIAAVNSHLFVAQKILTTPTTAETTITVTGTNGSVGGGIVTFYVPVRSLYRHLSLGDGMSSSERAY